MPSLQLVYVLMLLVSSSLLILLLYYNRVSTAHSCTRASVIEFILDIGLECATLDMLGNFWFSDIVAFHVFFVNNMLSYNDIDVNTFAFTEISFLAKYYSVVISSQLLVDKKELFCRC